jgi:hypothetical protein
VSGPIRAVDILEAWRDGMLEQGRPVPARRMSWATLSAKDRVLDQFIAKRLNEVVERGRLIRPERVNDAVQVLALGLELPDDWFVDE